MEQDECHATLLNTVPLWRAVLGYHELGDEDLVDPHSRGPSIWFQPIDAPRPQRKRIHVDVSVPHDQAEVRVAAESHEEPSSQSPGMAKTR